jgi:RNA polymerase sigma-70 factor (ECF subfamily)
MTDLSHPKLSTPALRLVSAKDRPEPDDAGLVQAALDGDASAFHRLYDAHAPHVARVLRRVLGSDQDATDVLQDAFVVVLERLNTLDNPSLFRAWVTRIAVFQARGVIRKRSRRRWLRVLSGEDPVEEPVALPASDEVDEALRATYEVLEKMDVEERIAFVLRRIEGMGVAEVATVCGVSLSTIKRRIGRGEDQFHAKALQHPVLREWLQGAER